MAHRAALIGVLVAFGSLALLVAMLTPPWEANDEPDHVQNVQTLVRGQPYRIEDGAGAEAHQPPLYYAVLAAWQALLGIDARDVEPVPGSVTGSVQNGLFNHSHANDGADHRLLTALRLPSVVLGVAAVTLTALAAALVSRDRWTPVVSAGTAAGIPKLAFVSGVVNNDNLATILGSVVTVVAIAAVVNPARVAVHRVAIGLLLGVLTGAMLITKVTSAAIGLGVIAALVAATPTRPRSWLPPVAAAGVGGLVVAGWWLVQNAAWYGDPLASAASVEHLRRMMPGVTAGAGQPMYLLFEAPGIFWASFWYTSGWNQFVWPTWVYLPFWIWIAAALLGWRRAADPAVATRQRRAGIVLTTLAASGLLAVAAVAAVFTQAQGRIGFFAVPALAVLVAVGLERWRMPVPARLAFAVLGMAATLLAIRSDVVQAYLAI